MMESDGDREIQLLEEIGFHLVFVSRIIVEKNVCRSVTLCTERFGEINHKVGNVETPGGGFGLKIAFGTKEFNS